MDYWLRNTHSSFFEFGFLSCKIEQISAVQQKPIILFAFVSMT